MNDLPSAALGSRARFPDLEGIYLNHSAVAPLSRPVCERIESLARDVARRGLGAVMDAMRERPVLREQLASLIGASPEDIALTSSTSEGVVAIAMNLSWNPGERIVLLRGEFPANTTPWLRAAELFDLEVAWLEVESLADPQGDGLEQLESILRQGEVRLVAMSEVQFQTGWRMPTKAVSELCRSYGAELFIDAIQGCGIVPIDVVAQGIDYLSCGGHKWLMGFEGTGFLYARADRAATLVPRTASWRSHEDPYYFLFPGGAAVDYHRPLRRSISMIEGGGANLLGHAALEAATADLLALGVGSIFEHVSSYLAPLEAGLEAMGFRSARLRDPSTRSGILSVALPEGTPFGPLVEAIRERGVACSTPEGWLRFAPHWPNPIDEVEQVLGAVKEALIAAR